MKDLTFRFYFIMVRYNNTIALWVVDVMFCAICLLADGIHSSVILSLFSSHRSPSQQVPNSKSRTMKSVGNCRIKKRRKTNNIK